MRIPRSKIFTISLQIILFLVIGLTPPLSATAAQKSRWRITAHIGEGRIRDAQWSSDGSRVIVQTDGSVFIHTANLKLLGKLPEGSTLFSIYVDSNRIAYITDNKHTVAFWNVRENEVERIFAQEKNGDIEFWDVAFSPDGKLIALLTNTGILTVLDIDTERIVQTTNVKDAFSLLWSPDGSRVMACGYVDRSGWFCYLINPTAAKVLEKFPTSYQNGIVWRPDGKQFGISGYQDRISIYNGETGDLVQDLRLDSNSSGSFSWSPDNKYIEINGLNLSVWDATIFKQVWSIPGIGAVKWSPDSKVMASTVIKDVQRNPRISSEYLSIIDATNGKEKLKAFLDTATLQEPLRYWESHWNPDGSRLLLTSAYTGDLLIFNPYTLKLLNSVTVRGVAQLTATASFSPDGSMIATRVADTGDIDLWSSTTGLFIKTLSSPVEGDYSKYNNFNAFSPLWSPNGKYLADSKLLYASYDEFYGRVHVWNIQSSTYVTLPKRTDKVSDFADSNGIISTIAAYWRPDGNALAVNEIDGLLRLIEFPFGKTIWTTKLTTGGPDNPCPIDWSPDGSRFLCGETIHDGTTGKLLVFLQDATGQYLDSAWTMDGKRVFGVPLGDGGPAGDLGVWDALTGKQLEFPIKRCHPFAINPDGKRIVCMMEVPYKGGPTVIADVNTGTILSEPLPLFSHQMFWSPDGKRLAMQNNIIEILEEVSD